MKRSYLGAVSEEGGSFGIVFLDFPGCTSAAESLEAVLASGAEALAGHIETMLDYGEAIPDPSVHDLPAVVDWLRDGPDDTEVEEGWVGLFPVAVDIDEEVRMVTVRMRADLVQTIVDLAQVRAEAIDSRLFIERAVEHEIERYRKSAA